MALEVARIDSREYERFVAHEGAARATVYHRIPWLSAVTAGLGMETVILGLYLEGALVGVLPGFLSSRFGVRMFGSPLRGSMTPYLGWLLRQSVELTTAVILEHLHAFCRRRLRCQYAELGFFQPPTTLELGSPQGGWRSSQRETYLLDLTPGEDSLWSKLDRGSRGKVKKAERAGLTVESIKDRRVMDYLFPMIEASYARHKAVSPHPKEFFLALHDHLTSENCMEVFAAIRAGKVIAGAIVLHDTTDARCMSSASDPQHNQYGPNNLLQWHIISWACRNGKLRYDFGGKGQAGIDRFKENFGPSPYAYPFLYSASPAAAVGREVVLRSWPAVQWGRYQLRRLSTAVRQKLEVGRSSWQQAQS